MPNPRAADSGPSATSKATNEWWGSVWRINPIADLLVYSLGCWLVDAGHSASLVQRPNAALNSSAVRFVALSNGSSFASAASLLATFSCMASRCEAYSSSASARAPAITSGVQIFCAAANASAGTSALSASIHTPSMQCPRWTQPRWCVTEFARLPGIAEPVDAIK